MKRVCANVEARRRSLVLFWFILGHLSSIDDCRARGTIVSQHEVIPRFRLCFPFYVKVTGVPPCGRGVTCQSARLNCACVRLQAQRTVIEAVVKVEAIRVAMAFAAKATDGAMTSESDPKLPRVRIIA